MDKIKIGIPRGMHYYYYSKFWQYFFNQLDVEVVISPKTNKEILERGMKIAGDEMCLSMKIYLGHVDYLKDQCDYLLVPRIDRYDDKNQTCTNFLAIYDLVHQLFDVKILNYNISKKETLLDGLIEICRELNVGKIKAIEAYEIATQKYKHYIKKKQVEQSKKLSANCKKILIVSHPYNIYDEYIGKPIVDILESYPIEIIYSDLFDSNTTNALSLKLSPNLYWKYSKESIGSILLCDEVDGIIFLSVFPCGLDSLVNELVMRKIDKPYLNLIIDDINSLTGIETRIESFMDIIV